MVKYLERTAEEREEKAKARQEKTQKKLAKKAALATGGAAAGSAGAGAPPPTRRSAEVAAKQRLPQQMDQDVLEIQLHWVPLIAPDAGMGRLAYGVPILKRCVALPVRCPGSSGCARPV